MASRTPGTRTAINANAGSTGVCISLLGDFAIWIGESEILPTSFPRRKALQLFKLIALAPGHQLHREQVVDLLWPHLTPRAAMAQLYKAIHHVRQAFASAGSPCPPDTLFEVQGEIVRLNAPAGIHSDVLAFEQLSQEAIRTQDLRLLQQAVILYKGDLLPADRYEEWTQPHRATLHARVVDVYVQLGRRWQEMRRLPEAADAYRQVLAYDETQEAAHRGLMEIYALQDSRARALRQYQQCALLLLQELGVEPSRETTLVYEQILNGEVQPLHSLYTPPAIEPLSPLPLVGRRAEKRLVKDLLDDLAQGKGGVLALEGPAGIGKTRLAQEILQTASQNWQVLWGSAYEHEGQLPYMSIVEALRKAIRSDPSDAHLIPAELAVAIPELPATASIGEMADRVAAQSALFAGVLRFLKARAQRTPVILILDDLHAADPGTWKLFHYLARETAEIALLLVMTWRSDSTNAAPTLENIMHSLARQGLLRRMAVEALPQEDHNHLLEQTLEGGSVDAELASALFRLSAGNPLFAREISRQLVAQQMIARVANTWRLTSGTKGKDAQTALPIPPSLQELVNSRLSSLTPAALRMLQFAAVVGWNIPVPLLERWSRLDEQHVLEAALLDVLDAAVDAGLLQERGLSYCFAHPLFRQVIYQQMSTVRRRALHGQVAVGLEKAFEDDAPALPIEAVAFHYYEAGNVERAVYYLIQTGDRAEKVFDHDSALQRYEEALSMLAGRRAGSSTDRLVASLHERLGDVHRAIGNIARSLDAYQQALHVLDECERATDLDYRRTLHRKITHAAILTPVMPVAAEHLQKAWELLTGEDPLEKARMLITQALFDWHANQLETAIEHAELALAISEREHAPVETSQALEMLAMAYLPLGRWEEAFEYELRRQTADWSPEIVVAVDAHLCLYQFRLQGAEPYRQVKQFIEKVAHMSANIGNLRCLAVCHFVLGSLALLQSEPAIATEHLTQALKLHQQVGSPAAGAYTIARLVDLLTATGEAQAAWAQVQAGLQMASQAAIRDHCVMMVHTAGIWNRLAVSDLPAAAELVGIAQQHESTTPPCAVCSVDRYAAIAAYYMALGEMEMALRYTEDALQLAQVARNRLGQARAFHVRGQIYATQNEIVRAKVDLAEAIDIFQELDNRYELAQTLLVLGNLQPTGARTQQEHQAQRQKAQELLEPFQRRGTVEEDE